MKNYYYCTANFTVYTETEKAHSNFPARRFDLIGAFKNRAQAEAEMINRGEYPENAKRI